MISKSNLEKIFYSYCSDGSKTFAKLFQDKLWCLDDVIKPNDPLRKICLFSFVPGENDENDGVAGGEEVQVYDLFTKTDCRRLWQRIFQDCIINAGLVSVEIEKIRGDFFRNVPS